MSNFKASTTCPEVWGFLRKGWPNLQALGFQTPETEKGHGTQTLCVSEMIGHPFAHQPLKIGRLMPTDVEDGQLSQGIALWIYPPRILVAKRKVYYKRIFSPGFVWGEPKELHPTKLEVFSFRCFAYCYCLNLFEQMRQSMPEKFFVCHKETRQVGRSQQSSSGCWVPPRL